MRAPNDMPLSIPCIGPYATHLAQGPTLYLWVWPPFGTEFRNSPTPFPHRQELPSIPRDGQCVFCISNVANLFRNNPLFPTPLFKRAIFTCIVSYDSIGFYAR